MMSKTNRRYLRSVLMLVVAMGAMVWTAVDQFDIPIEEMKSLLLGVAVGVAVIVVAAALLLLLAKLVRSLLFRIRKRNTDHS